MSESGDVNDGDIEEQPGVLPPSRYDIPTPWRPLEVRQYYENGILIRVFEPVKGLQK